MVTTDMIAHSIMRQLKYKMLQISQIMCHGNHLTRIRITEEEISETEMFLKDMLQVHIELL